VTAVVVAEPFAPLPSAAEVPDQTVEAIEYVRLGMKDMTVLC